MTIKEQARSFLRRLALPIPQRERTLNVVFTIPGAVPSIGRRCLCTIAANHAWRAAHENHCTKIVVHNGAGHKHSFDTVEFLKSWTIRRLGHLPGVFQVAGRTPRWLATTGHQALGNEFDTTRPTFQVPVDVSSLTAGVKETFNANASY